MRNDQTVIPTICPSPRAIDYGIGFLSGLEYLLPKSSDGVKL